MNSKAQHLTDANLSAVHRWIEVAVYELELDLQLVRLGVAAVDWTEVGGGVEGPRGHEELGCVVGWLPLLLVLEMSIEK